MTGSPSSPGSGGIFYNFQIEGAAQQESSSSRTKSASKSEKPVKTTHACAECKRRKIRCDGNDPCRQCLFNRVPRRCLYDERRPRVITSRKTVEGLSQSLEECRSVLNRLYPNQEISSLLHLTRQELLDLLDKPALNKEASSLQSPLPVPSPLDSSEHSPQTASKHSITNLEQIPSADAEWDEERRGRDQIPVEADDINALSLAMDKRASYLGTSSIKAALTVMLKIQPRLGDSLKPTLSLIETKTCPPPSRQRPDSSKAQSPVYGPWKIRNVIDAYFKRIHILIPMLDETAFRTEFFEGHRKDSAWLALANAVLAMGSIAASKSTDFSHFIFYNKAMDHLSIDAFGSSRIETVQALTIIGGFYLHYVNRPNMANALLGTTMRMACALGLHRELPSRSETETDIRTAEVRRRTWWSLFCLDTWGSTTMGRPSFGRWGPAINVQPPELGIDQAMGSSQHIGVLIIIENIKFCKIATHIQDVLASTPFLDSKDRESLDLQLRKWYTDLPWLLQTTAPCVESFYIAKCVMKWRYQNLRMLLHRQVLLALASDKASSQSPEEHAAVETCWNTAMETIGDISKEWTRTQMLGWNAAWFLYQAVMIPLVSLFWHADSFHAPEWRKSIELVIELLDKMEDWSVTASRSRDVVRQIYTFILEGHSIQTDASPLNDNWVEEVMGRYEYPMSPLGLDINIASTQDWGWDLDGMFWAPTMASQDSDAVYNNSHEGNMTAEYDVLDFQV